MNGNVNPWTFKNKFEQTPEECRPYKTHQLISLVGINLQRKSIVGLVELTLVPKRAYLKNVKVNAKQCRIYKILINDTFEAQFDYYDVSLEITDPDAPKNNSLENFATDHRNAILECDPDAGGGEVLVRLPPEASHLIVEGRPFRLTIEYSLENPQSGMHFVVPEEGSSLEKCHMFTTRYENSARLWFPCIDSYSEVCTWKLEFTVDESLTAISCGDLVEVVQAADGSRNKTYHYYLSVPTAAPNIGLAVGPFEIYVDPNMHEVTHFCLPGLVNMLRWTSRFLYEIFEFFEELLASRYPYSCFKNVYVAEAYEEMTSYASLCIMDMNLLHTSAIIDQTYITRRFSALSLAEQFYSCFISMQHSCDAWLTKGIANYLCGLYLKKFFGNNEYRHWIHSELQEVIKYEQNYGGIILDASTLDKHSNSNGIHNTNSNSSSQFRAPNPHANVTGGDGGFYFSLANPQTISPTYLKLYSKKAHLVIRMLEHRIGNQLLLQVFNKQMSLATLYITQIQQSGIGTVLFQPPAVAPGAPNQPAAGPGTNATNPMLISTTSFTRSIFTVTGKDMTVFMDQWVRQGGHVRFHMSFIFNRKRNTVELELKQECLQQLGVRQYVGPLTVALQELDGTFKHVLQIEGTHAKADIVCHSKSRRQKKKKIPLCTGEEVDMDLSVMDAESPVLWIRLDPEMTLIRAVDTRQPDFQWQYQLKHERDVTAQMEAIWALEAFPTNNTKSALTDVIENEQTYYKVRCEACYCLAKVANSMIAGWTGPPAMLTIFRKLFGSFSCPQIPKHNDFSNLQHYFLQKAIPVAMATLRNVHGIVPSEVLKFLLDLFKYNDNSRNRLSDNYYRAALVRALGNTVTPAVSLLQPCDVNAETVSMSSDTRAIMEEITRCLNLEKLLHCYKYTVSVECLRALRKLQKFNHLPNNVELFKPYAVYGQYFDVRIAALEAIVDYTKTDGTVAEAEYLLEFIESDPSLKLRHDLCVLIMQSLNEKPLDRRKSKSPFHNKSIALRLWHKFNYEFSVDARVRCDLVDLYYTLFGTRKPVCLMDDDSTDTYSRRKSPLTTREGVEDLKVQDDTAMQVEEPPKVTSAKVLSSKRESMASDNSGELPEAMDTTLPTYFQPGMFKKDGDKDSKPTVEEESIPSTKEGAVAVEETREEGAEHSHSHKKHHSHHHSKGKKKKDKKKKHKHKHKHKHHSHEHKKKSKEETLSSGSSASNSPIHSQM